MKEQGKYRRRTNLLVAFALDSIRQVLCTLILLLRVRYRSVCLPPVVSHCSVEDARVRHKSWVLDIDLSAGADIADVIAAFCHPKKR